MQYDTGIHRNLNRTLVLKRLAPVVVFLYIVIMFGGCSENDGNIGSGINDPGFSGTVTDTLLYPAMLDTFYSEQYNSGQSLNLYIGEYSGFKTRFLLKFTYFTSLPDSFRIDSAFMNLTSYKVFADTTLTYPDFTASVYEITEMLPENEWYESSVTWDSLVAWEAMSVHDFAVSSAIDTETVAFQIDTSIINQWIYADSTNPNMGFLVDYSGDVQFIKSFFSSENADTSLKPNILLYITPFDSTSGDTAWIEQEPDSANIYATNDVYVGIDTVDLDYDRLYLGRTQAHRALYLVDFSALFPSFGTYINKMEFVIFLDTTHSLYLGDMTTISPYRMSSDSWLSNTSDAEFDYISASSSAITADSVVLNISSFVNTYTANNWLENPDQNYGFMIKFTVESGAIARLPIYTSESANVTKRPYLHVIYSEMEQ